MADITRVATGRISNKEMNLSGKSVAGLTAGAALALHDFVYIKASDGKVYPATGAADDEAAQAVGFVPVAHVSGDTDVTIVFGDVTLEYASGMTPGTQLYLSGATAGALADAQSTGGKQPLAWVIDATRIRVPECISMPLGSYL